MTDVIVYNPNLVGISKILRTNVLTGYGVAISSDTRKLITLDFTTLPILITSVTSLDSEPTGLASSDSLLWVTFKDGTLRSYTIATPPVQQSSEQLDCHSDWIYGFGNSLVFGGSPGTLLVRNSSTNAITRAEGILPEIIGGFVGQATGYHYIFSGMGKGRVVVISESTGKITLGNLFNSTNVVGHLSAQRNQSLNEFYTVSHDRRIHFDITDPDAPIVSEQEDLFGTEPSEPGFIGGTTADYTTAGVPPLWYPWVFKQRGRLMSIRAGAFAKGVYVPLYQVGAIAYTNPTIADDGQVITL